MQEPPRQQPARLDKATALILLAAHLAAYRSLDYAELERRIASPSPDIVHGKGPTGGEYTIETNIFWDDRQQRHIRVMADLTAHPQQPLLGFLPIYIADAADSFILAPDGTFIGELTAAATTQATQLQSD